MSTFLATFSALLINLFALSFVHAQTRQRFSSSGLVQEDVGLGTNMAGTVAAFTDFNGDKYTDLIVLSADQTKVTVQFWNSAAYKYELSPAAISADFVITNVVPADFDYDGKVDLLLMGQKNPEDPQDSELLLRIYFGNGVDAFDEKFVNLLSSKLAQPIVVDFTGDMRPDLVGIPFDGQKPFSVWKNRPPNDQETDIRIVFDVTAVDGGGAAFCDMANAHSGAFVDLDGDCLADLFLTCQKNADEPVSYQIWRNEKEKGYAFKRSGNFPTGTGHVSFSDMDGDGTMDMVFPVCINDKCAVHVAYNNQIPLCQKDSDSGCRRAKDLCVSDPNFSFSMQEGENHVVFSTDQAFGAPILLEDQLFKGKLPVPTRPGDFNVDGFPDVLVVNNVGKLFILKSIPCTSATCSPADVASDRRTFTPFTDGMETLTDDKRTTRGAAFFDLDENGTLDIMLLESTAEKNTARNVNVLVNNFSNDAFFMKTLMLNGVCSSWCPAVGKFPSSKPYGVNYSGASFKYLVTDTHGSKRATQVAQLPQTGYQGLNTPYSLFGLGRTNNYLEELFVGSTRHQDKHYYSWTGVIPNSQLVIIPYQPPGSQDPSSWKMELYVNPSDYAPWVVLVLVSSMAMLSALVAFLTWMEKREDDREKQRNQFRINFDAL